MSPRKLSDSDRQEILELYRNTEETTSSLANRFGVSSSTISRFLKSSLSPSNYEDLIQAKRLARTSVTEKEQTKKSKSKKSATKSPKKKATKPKIKPQKAAKSQPISVSEQKELPINLAEDVELDDSLLAGESIEDEPELTDKLEETIGDSRDTEIVTIEDSNPDLELEDESDEESLESVQEVAAMFGEDLDEEEDKDDDEDFEEEGDDSELLEETLAVQKQLQVLSLNDATFPLVCYLVIDRHSELVTKPMKDFSHLGDIPTSESLQKTLPIFDNHKVAKRFCVRKGKVIKVPDARILQKTSSYLQAKGISRILMDGKIYSIVD